MGHCADVRKNLAHEKAYETKSGATWSSVSRTSSWTVRIQEFVLTITLKHLFSYTSQPGRGVAVTSSQFFFISESAQRADAVGIVHTHGPGVGRMEVGNISTHVHYNFKWQWLSKHDGVGNTLYALFGRQNQLVLLPIPILLLSVALIYSHLLLVETVKVSSSSI